MKFYKRDPHRAHLGMAHLTLKQRGAYNSVLDLLYAQDDGIPDNDKRVAKMMSCHWREWATVKAELIALGKVWVEGGMICAKGVQATRKEASDFSQRQSNRSNKRWVNEELSSENNGHDMRPRNASTPTPTPIEERKSLNGHEGGEVGKQKGPPRHGQKTKDGKRVWCRRDTPEWKSYADEYSLRHDGMCPPTQWNGAGTWFNLITGDA